MTQHTENDSVLVRLRALVMERDDSSGGWLPMMGTGGSLSTVSVVKRTIPKAVAQTDGNTPIGEQKKHEFVIYGERICDQSVLFRCVICHDFNYKKVMPTFHHWEQDGTKLGLCFLTAADGRAFDKGVMAALVEIIGGMNNRNNFLLPGSIEEEKDVFMAVYLPYSKPENNKSSPSNECTSVTDTPLTPPVPPEATTCEQSPTCESRKYTFDQPIEDEKAKAHCRLNMRQGENLICKYCRKSYNEGGNTKGSCNDAPECVGTSIDVVTCIPCTRAVLSRCLPDDHRDFGEPCLCDLHSTGRCAGKWLWLALLSFVLPCLWCYPPLKLCHLCGSSCGLCGGKHEPLS